MMKFIVIVMLSCATLLAGCAKNPDGTITQPDYSAIIAQVQGYCKTACGFVPTAGTILQIVTGGNPGVIAAVSISQAICAAIAPPMMAGKRAFVHKTVKGWHVTPGAVNGVQIQGERV